MRDTARRAFIAALVFVAVLATALALWKLKLLIALLFLAFVIAAAMRPGVEALRRRHVPRGLGILLHYLALAGLVAVLLWQAVPSAITQIRDSLGGNIPTTAAEAKTAKEHASGFKRRALSAIQHRLEDLPSGSEVVNPAIRATRVSFEIVIGIFFTLASAAYWIFERDRAVELVTSMLPRKRRRIVRDTWDLIDLKLGAYVRGQGLLILLVATLLSAAFAAIGLPLWLLIGPFAGIVEIVPVIGPITAGAVAIAAGLTESWQLGLYAGIAVLAVRLAEDYVVIPRVLGEAVGLSPLLVLFSVAGAGILFGGFAVLLAVPLAAVLATLFQVIMLNQNPADEEVPTVLFPAKDAETTGSR
jgi:predicted PurR-regulated permease PerM